MAYLEDDPNTLTGAGLIPPTPLPDIDKGAPGQDVLPNLSTGGPDIQKQPIPSIPKEPGEVPTGGASPTAASQGAEALPLDVIGDIPPPPIPSPPSSGLAGAPGAATFARPGTSGARPFRTSAFGSPSRGPRFGPGVAITGGAPATLAGGDELGLNPDDVGELLRRMSGGA